MTPAEPDPADAARGYVTDTSYADPFHRELSPVWLGYVAALHGVAPRDLARPFTYLELGCGFGHSVVVNAGAFPHAEFHACDVNPAHVEGGRREAAALGVGNVRFHEASFEALPLADLPGFDFIVLHGVYSWVDAEARRAVRSIIQARLSPGGLVYVSYNCLPGWAVEVPLRKLLWELAAGAAGDTARRARHALAALEQLGAAPLRYFQAHAEAGAALAAYVQGPGNYLVHEFLNRSWEPFYSIDVADEMASAGVRYLGSATLADNHPALVISAPAAAAVARLETPRQRELAFDFAADRRFRRDVFVRAAGSAAAGAGAGGHLGAAVIGSLAPEAIGVKVAVPRGAVHFQPGFIADLRALTARGSLTVADAVTALGGAGRRPQEIARNLTFLVAAGVLTPFAQARAYAPAAKPRQPARAAVAHVLAQAVERRERRAIPSEVLGNGVPVDPLTALAVSECLQADHDVDTLAERLRAGARRLEWNTRRPAGADGEAADEARSTARNVLENVLPGLARLGLIV